ncbi:MAG: FAD-dependent oxidoreductase [Firmicutes bacterium]|nr:FAD-dependent oxidoreductase [Bacillota bacterium]
MVLIEKWSALGGNLSAVVLMILGFHTVDGRQVVGGLGQDIVDRLVAAGGSPGHVPGLFGPKSTLVPYDPVVMNHVLFELVKEHNVGVFLHSAVTDVLMEDDRVAGAFVQERSGTGLVLASCIVDCSGDADVAFLSGAPFTVGRPKDGVTQPLGHSFIMANVDTDRLRAFLRDNPRHVRLGNVTDEQISVAGFADLISAYPGYAGRDEIDLFTLPRPGTVLVNATRIRGRSGLSTHDLSRAEAEGTQQVLKIAEFLCARVPGFENAFVAAMSARAGIRETRHIVGGYTLTRDDCLAGATFDDGIARGAYPIDIHDPDSGTVILTHIGGDGAYDIPYRCLVPQGVEQLIVAGRPISASHEAHGSLRVMATCMAMGEAAGTAAALSVRLGVSPRELDPKVLRRRLRERGAIV